MNILFISSEIIPFASSGGLGDVCAALPKALSRNNNILCVMPLYGCIDKKKYSVKPTGLKLNISFSNSMHIGNVFSQSYENITTYFIQSNDFFDREYLYGDEYGDYDDNFERFLFFQKAVVQLIDLLNLKIDIVHCNDWQSSLVPILLKYGTQGKLRLGNEKTLLTIHNLAHQGIFDNKKFYLMQLPLSCFSDKMLEFYGNLNCFKGGLIEADAVNTVSPSYAKEILLEDNGRGLHGVLNSRSDKIHGILNGVDYERWSPDSDSYIPCNYSINDLSGKIICKKNLQEILNLEQRPNIPLISMVSRLTHQKGLDLLAESFEQLMTKDIQIIFLGTGELKYEEQIKNMEKKWPNKIAAKIEFSSSLAHKFFAGSDMFLMPSMFEPCGQSQIFSMRYGTIPIAFRTGGLIDTITDYPKKSSTGFLFNDFNSISFLEKVDFAIETYNDSSKWSKIIKRAMKSDFSVNQMSKNYINLYQKILSN